MAREGYIKKSFTFEGKRYYVYGKTEKEANKKLILKQRDLEEHRLTVSSSMTVAEWSERAIATYKTNVKPITLSKFKSRVSKNILSEIGSMRLKDVKPIHCQNCMNKCSGTSKAHINLVYQALQFIFRTAVDNELIVRSPAEKIVKPTGYQGKRREITPSERKALTEAVKTFRNGDIFLFMLYCGCRPSEARNICHNDFTVIDSKPMLHIRGTKTSNADRIVPCPKELYDRYNVPSFEPIFLTTKGNILDDKAYQRLTNRLYREMNIIMGCTVIRNELIPPYPLAPDFMPYCLRHTYCTDLARKGIDIRTAQKLMGHSNIQLTANIYTHVSQSDISNVAELLFSEQK